LAGVLFDAGLYFGLGLLAHRAYRALFGPAPPVPATPESGAVAPPGPPVTRRRFLLRGTQALGAGAAAGLGYAMVVEPWNFKITERTIRISGLPARLDGLRVVQLTDVHLGPWLSAEYVRAVVDASNRLEP